MKSQLFPTGLKRQRRLKRGEMQVGILFLISFYVGCASSFAQSPAPTAPIISTPSSTLLMPSQIAIAAQPDARIYVTTDESTPDGTGTSFIYLGPIDILYSQTVKAVAIRNGQSSSISTAEYELDEDLWPKPDPGDTTAPTINLELPVATE